MMSIIAAISGISRPKPKPAPPVLVSDRRLNEIGDMLRVRIRKWIKSEIARLEKEEQEECQKRTT